jgi:hypothetical protein
MIHLQVHIPTQKLLVLNSQQLIAEYLVSSAKNGVGEQYGSEQTPRGLHVIRAKIGAGCPINTIFLKRRQTGEIFTPEMREQFPERDWMLTRIMWLCGLERHKNRFGQVDTMKRKIYIHGAPDEVMMGIPGSKGCIRMHNHDLLVLFDLVPVGTQINIVE